MTTSVASGDRPSIAVLMTCHNRRERTLACLRSVSVQDSDVLLDVYLVDDGSTDGTASAVRTRFPGVHVVSGSGDLYWSGGLRRAYDLMEGSDTDADFVLWLNDDVELSPSALGTLLATHADVQATRSAPVLVVGGVRDPESALTTYSGVVRPRRARPTQFSLVAPGSHPLPCETMNGNVVLISRRVHRLLGRIDDAFTHAMSDLDYGLRAGDQGCEVWLAPGHVGTCARGPATDPEAAPGLRQGILRLCSPKGIPPKDWMIFTRRHAGKAWPLFCASPYVRFVVGSWRRRFRRERTTSAAWDARCGRRSFLCCGVRVDAFELDGAAEEVLGAARAQRASRVHLCNVYTLSLAHRDPSFREALNRGDLNLPDGMPLVWIGRRLGFEMAGRVYGPDLVRTVIDRGRAEGVRHYLYGSTPAVVRHLAASLEDAYPGALIVAADSPPFRPLRPEERDALTERVRATRADVVWVGLGTPKQDRFLDELGPHLGTTLVAVGAAFDFLSGSKAQAPRLLRDHGLEWAYRLLREPRRLWRRYLVGNVVFLAGVASGGAIVEQGSSPVRAR